MVVPTDWELLSLDDVTLSLRKTVIQHGSCLQTPRLLQEQQQHTVIFNLVTARSKQTMLIKTAI